MIFFFHMKHRCKHQFKNIKCFISLSSIYQQKLCIKTLEAVIQIMLVTDIGFEILETVIKSLGVQQTFLLVYCYYISMH